MAAVVIDGFIRMSFWVNPVHPVSTKVILVGGGRVIRLGGMGCIVLFCGLQLKRLKLEFGLIRADRI